MKNEQPYVNGYFKLYASCIPVKGVKRAGICDIQRGIFETISMDLFEVLSYCKNYSFKQIIKQYGEDNTPVIEEYFAWLIKMEFGFWCTNQDELKRFPNISVEWNMPFDITNAIIDIGAHTSTAYSKLIKEIIALAIPHIQIRCYSKRTIDFFVSLLEQLEFSRVKTIDIITPFYIKFSSLELEKICQRHLRIGSIVFHGSPFEENVSILENLTPIIYTKQVLKSQNCCGLSSPLFFSINQNLFNESQKYNTCLNRKISIDVNGEIKNCPSMKESFGNIKDTTLEEALNKKGFKKLWNTNKDKIKVCQDCEFRYICTDCRAYIENPEDIYSKPLKCGYNPYTAEWEEWSTNPLKQKAIEYYGMEDLVVKEKQ